ncbi:MAG: hypothetical protein HOJ95_12710 [Nitrospinaceae bacterium]|nr:hypothetical protein [Nitrospinaceae bacterium]MBT5948562.1 hypothetical protein [Nitrospinaceae bacterium]MBT6395562.1 hypothetical protein [Nitrospinaceae bacterium]MBT7858391.1 hypothetical protein [Nitrospinaceae bacterium]
MGLRINQNIAALNAARNLRSTDAAMSKSLERLSSGFRINRAADDPAGLIISENLRAQIAGLGQAVKNSSNAVNVVRTAEAALDEVLKQLRAIRTLALDALNTGSSDAIARAADQTQIDSSIATINRIGNTTQFGKIKLLNGSSGVRGSTNSNDLEFIAGSTNTVAGSYDVNISQVATKGNKTFTVKNEFETGDAAVAFDLNASSTAAFTVDFGAGITSATDVKELGAQLTAAGLVDDTSQTGVKVRFNEQDATAYVTIDSTAAAAADKIDTTLLGNLNGTTLGKIVNFAPDAAGGETKFHIAGRFAGLGFTASDLTVDTTGANTGFSANTALQTGLATPGDPTTTNTIQFTIDFGTGLDSTGKKALALALRDGGLTDSTVTAGNLSGAGANNSTLAVSLNTTTAVATITLTTDGNMTETSSAVALQSGIAIDSASNLDRFIAVGIATDKLTFSTSVAAVVANGAGDKTSGVSTALTFGANPGLASTEVATLGGGTGLAVADIKTIGETLTINDSTVVDIAAGTALTSVVSRINSAIEADELKVKATFKADTASSDLNNLIFTNTEFGSTLTTVKSTKGGSLTYQLSIGTSIQNVQGKDVAGTINGVKANGDGQFLTLSSSGDNANGIKVKFTGTAAPVDGTLKATVTQDSLLFQVGANSGQTVKQSIEDVRANKLGKLATGLLTSARSIADINVITSDGANDALNLVDDAINTITTIRGNLGAFQANVLESNINSLGVAKENLSAAESAIRDADFAEETVQFTRNQILLQAGTAILTQANAIPQAVLQLLA